jgi:hypothetical protein
MRQMIRANRVLQRCGNMFLPDDRIKRLRTILAGAYQVLLSHAQR